MKMRLHGKSRAVAWTFVLLSAGVAQAQLGGSLTVENETALVDVIGRGLPGTWGFPDTAVWVEIRATNPSGGIAPPDPVTGEGNESQNPLVRETYMGAGILMVQNPGRFSEVFSERLGGGSFYARVYDRTAPGGSLYYLDSTSFQDDGTAQYAYPNFSASTWKLIETGAVDVDSDGDGIPDALESDMGLDPGNPDTDGDGWDDLFEVLNSPLWNPTEPDPTLEVVIHAPVFVSDPGGLDGPHTVTWPTKAGVAYRLEYHPTQVDAPGEEWVEIWSGVAADEDQVEEIDWVLDESPAGFFRVWAMP
jgi:hypothetical protein